MHSIKIKKAQQEDCPIIYKFIKDLAKFEKAPQEVDLTLDKLLEDGFGSNPAYECFIATSNGTTAGMALFYPRYSTWKGRTLYLEDLYIEPAFRGQGIAKKLLRKLCEVALARECLRLEWQVLDWNHQAIELYKSVGASLDPEWINGRMVPLTMQRLIADLRE